MDLETFIQSLFNFVKSCNDYYFVLYAVATCLVTQVVKKLIVNKVKVDVLHKFDVAVVLPFIFGTAFATLNCYVTTGLNAQLPTITQIIVDGATIGALATVIFKFVSSLSGQSLKSLLKDDVFGVFYNQLLYFGTARQALVTKQITLSEFVQQVKLVSANATAIYKEDTTNEVKKSRLARLLAGIVDDGCVNSCLTTISEAMVRLVAPQTKNSTAK